MFAGMDDEYMKARSADVKDISERLIAVLHHGSGAQSMEMEQAIILADDLAPSETIQLDRSKVLAFVTRGIDEFPHRNPCPHDEHSCTGMYAGSGRHGRQNGDCGRHGRQNHH